MLMRRCDLREVGEALKAVGDPVRLRALKLLEAGELCVCQMTAVLGLSQPAVSRHLRVLRQAGLVVERKDGRYTYYRLDAASPVAEALHGLIPGWAEGDPAVRADRAALRKVLKRPLEDICGRSPGGRR